MKKNIIYVALMLLLVGIALFITPDHAAAQLAKGQPKFLGNIHTKGQTPLNFDKYWNQVTPGNAGKWASCEQARDDMNYWLWLDRAYSYAQQNNFPFKLHTLVWGHSSGEPAWMKSVPQNEQKDEVVEWFEAVAERYPDIDMIDVVNEPLHAPPSYTDALGGKGETGWDWVIWSFEKAREYFPDAVLILNEYNVLNYTNECQNFLALVKLLQARGLIDAVGLQAHSLETIPFATIKQNLESVAATGLDIYISEYEARGDDDTQLALYQQHFPYFWEHPSVKGITLWGYLEGDMWRSEAYLLAADGLTERPALMWLRHYFDYDPQDIQYRLDADVDGNGSVSLNPPGGIYDPFTEVSVTAVADDGYKFSHWTGDKGGSENPIVIAMTSNRLLTAHFVEKGYVPEYDLSVTTAGSGTINQTPTGTRFEEGTVVTLTAVPDENQRFTGWSGASSSKSPTIQITMNGNKTLTANFAEIGGEGCSGETVVSMPFKQNGEGEYCWVASGTLSYINSWNAEYVEVNGQDFTNTFTDAPPAAADGKYHIYYLAKVPWAHFEIVGTSDGNLPDDTENPPTDNEDPPVGYTLTTQVTGQGSVSPASGSYAEGSTVTLTALPADGYIFSGWSGDADGTAATIQITMDSDKSVTALFEEETSTPGCGWMRSR